MPVRRAACRPDRRRPTRPTAAARCRTGARMFDRPPPSTMTSGSRMLITCASARARRSFVAHEARLARGIACGRGGRDVCSQASAFPVLRRWSRSRPGPGQERFDAARLAAEARRPGALVVARATAAGCGPIRRRSRSGPIEHMAANHDARADAGAEDRRRIRSRRPRLAPSVASDSAKQLASLVIRTARPRRRSRSTPIGLSFRQIEFEPRSSPVAREIDPGVPMPTLPCAPTAASAAATRSAIASSTGR